MGEGSSPCHHVQVETPGIGDDVGVLAAPSVVVARHALGLGDALVLTAGLSTIPFDSSSTRLRWISCHGVWLSGYV